MENNNHLMLAMQERFQKSIKALMVTEIETQRRLRNVESSLQVATAPSSSPTVGKPSTAIPTNSTTALSTNTASAPSSPSTSNNPNASLVDVSSDIFSSDGASDSTITPDNSPTPAKKPDTPLPNSYTPKNNKRPISELDHSRRPPRSDQVPKITEAAPEVSYIAGQEDRFKGETDVVATSSTTSNAHAT
ncbi:uncharacterized protein LOC135712499 [Ochlerotatus camptorhynchus]|uniref:uncharacterized protein LOC135712499 n=1 Tax=Ochlerotatus camptorhynchus TaxID=644619 RepID=UPI0031DF249C